MIPVYGYEDQHVAVLGLGRSGLSAARALEAGGAHVICWDDGGESRLKALELGYELRDLTKAGAFEGVSALIVSPGIPHLYPSPHLAIAQAYEAGVPVDNDIGLFFRSFGSGDFDMHDTPPRVIAVTGSNGKSTTSALIYHILEHCDIPCQLAGNIGRGVLDIEEACDGEVIVLELSSYQTELARALTPDVAVFTNLSPDHLDRHGGKGGYFAAKRRLFAEGGPDRAVIGIDEPEGRFLAGQMVESFSDRRLIRISGEGKISGNGWSVFAKKGFLAEWQRGRQAYMIDLREMDGLPGAHNHQNACAAYAAVRSLNIAPRKIEDAMRSFKGLPHRSQIVGEKKGVRYVNDSKATNVDAAAKALSAFKDIHWIAGGVLKEGGFDNLMDHLNTVKKAYLIGRSAGDFATALGDFPFEICQTMDIAVARAADEAKEGETVLLAPACASFDQFKSFEERGEAFIKAFEDL